MSTWCMIWRSGIFIVRFMYLPAPPRSFQAPPCCPCLYLHQERWRRFGTIASIPQDALRTHIHTIACMFSENQEGNVRKETEEPFLSWLQLTYFMKAPSQANLCNLCSNVALIVREMLCRVSALLAAEVCFVLKSCATVSCLQCFPLCPGSYELR